MTSNDIPVHTYNVRIMLSARKMLPCELAEAAGISVGAVYGILSGRTRDPRVSTMMQIAAVLDVHVGVLLDMNGVEVVPHPPTIAADDAQIIDDLIREAETAQEAVA